MWIPEIDFENGPVYLAIADALGRDVECGRLQAGDRVPPHRDLARALGVNVGTVTRAYAEAGRRGLIDGEVGRGTFVRPRGLGMLDVVRPLERRPELINLALNVPTPPEDRGAEAEVLASLARDPQIGRLLDGYQVEGLPEHRAAGAAWLARLGHDAQPARVLVTHGGQHAMAITFATLCQAGDLVLADALTYTGVKSLCASLGLRLAGVEMDADGMLPDALEAACRKQVPRALYMMPSIQNPTGIVLSAERRRAIAEIARKYGVPIVEDDTYTFLCADAPPPLSSFAPERTIALSGTAKSLSPGLRTGFLSAPLEPSEPALDLEPLATTLASFSWMATALTAEIAARWIRGDEADRRIRWKRDETRARRAIADRHLGRYGTCSHPESGHLWLALPEPWRSDAFVDRAHQRGVAVASAEAFVVGRDPAPHSVRLSLDAPSTREELAEGLATLAQLLEQPATRAPRLV